MVRSKQTQELFQKFNFCAYCSHPLILEYGHPKSITKDHIVARAKGGNTVVAACYECNHAKGATGLFNFLSKLYHEDPEEAVDRYYNLSRLLTRGERVLLRSETTDCDDERVYLGKAIKSRQRGYLRDKKADCRPQPPRQLKLF